MKDNNLEVTVEKNITPESEENGDITITINAKTKDYTEILKKLFININNQRKMLLDRGVPEQWLSTVIYLTYEDYKAIQQNPAIKYNGKLTGGYDTIYGYLVEITKSEISYAITGILSTI